MGKSKNKRQAVIQIRNYFEKAEIAIKEKDEETAKKHVKKARRAAMRYNLKLPREMRKKFCRDCYSFFTPANCKIRMKKGYINLNCLNCGKVSRYKCI